MVIAPRASSCSLAGSVYHAVDEYVETLTSMARLISSCQDAVVDIGRHSRRELEPIALAV